MGKSWVERSKDMAAEMWQNVTDFDRDNPDADYNPYLQDYLDFVELLDS